MSGYRIGAVAKMTGVSTDTIRAWERRFGVVVPERGENNNRYYTDEHVALLTRIKRLVDAGQAIGTVARLSSEELEKRVQACQTVAPLAPVASGDSVVIFSIQSPAWLQRCAEVVSDRPRYVSELGELESILAERATDFLLFDIPSLTEGKARAIKEILEQYRVHRSVVMFRYASNRQLQTLVSAGVNPIKGPIEPFAFARLIGLDKQERQECYTPRRYSSATLSKLAEVSTAVRCECPQHLVEIIGLLNDFEEYCAECETESPENGQLHAHLRGLTSHARGTMERAMSAVVRADGIELADAAG